MRIVQKAAVPATTLVGVGAILGVIGDVMLQAPGPFGLNMFVWVGAIAGAAVVLHFRAGIWPDWKRFGWLAVAVVFASGLAWRDSTTLKPLALACATVAFALSAYRYAADWVRTASVTQYALAWITGALHAWFGSGRTLVEAVQSTRPLVGGTTPWRRASGVARGLLIAAPLVLLFGALFVSADAVFKQRLLDVVRIDFDEIASHVVLFAVTAWIATGYLRGYVTGTELPPMTAGGTLTTLVPERPRLAIIEVTTALGAINLLFLLFVVVQFRYLFGGDVLVQVTPGLTYAEYARRGFFELVVAVALVVPVLLAADWVLHRATRRDDVVFRVMAGLQIALVLAIAASALERLRIYYVSYGLTEQRFYAMAILIGIGAVLLWLAATVLRGRRDLFGFGALVAGFGTVAVLFVVNPDAIIARTNVARLTATDAVDRFDVAYATRLSGDAVPVLIDALPELPADVQCPLARHLLNRWPPDRAQWIRNWSWSAARASAKVRANESQLRAMVNQDCRGREGSQGREAAR